MSTRLRPALAVLVVGVAALVTAPLSLASGPILPTKDPFYAYSKSLKHVAPGTILRERTVTLAENGAATPITATQLLYRTTGELGQPTVTVATVIRPTVHLGPTKISPTRPRTTRSAPSAIRHTRSRAATRATAPPPPRNR